MQTLLVMIGLRALRRRPYNFDWALDGTIFRGFERPNSTAVGICLQIVEAKLAVVIRNHFISIGSAINANKT